MPLKPVITISSFGVLKVSMLYAIGYVSSGALDISIYPVLQAWGFTNQITMPIEVNEHE